MSTVKVTEDLLMRVPGPDLADFEEVKAEGLDLGEDAVKRRSVGKQAGEHGIGALLLRRERRERRQQGRAEVAIDPDLVQDGVITHEPMVRGPQVKRRHRNPVTVRRSGAAG
jgi:hypothetical protein